MSHNIDIDWSRMAEPQTDGYDTDIVLKIWQEGLAPFQSGPVFRRAANDSRHQIFDGRVAVRRLTSDLAAGMNFIPAPTDDPNIRVAETLLSRWPTAARQFESLIHSYYPVWPRGADIDDLKGRTGSSSHHLPSLPGAVFATAYDPNGLAQAFVHEMAHTKLRALGMQIETTWGLLINDPTELYESPVRKDQGRPMTAVFHAEYSFMHVIDLDIRMIGAETDDKNRFQLVSLLSRNVPRMQSGLATIKTHAKVDTPGKDFMCAFYQWAERTIEHGQSLVDAWN